MSTGSRIFVFLASLIAGVSFFAATLALAHEYWTEGHWVDFLAIDSHLFLFFPTFGVICLVAFYLPATIVVDLCWRRLKFGKLRFLTGYLAMIVLSWVLSVAILASPNKPAWEIEKAKFLADRGSPAGCASTGDCDRLPLLDAFQNLRAVSQSRGSLKPFVRHCHPDPLIDRKVQEGPRRFCLVSTAISKRPKLLTDAQCCSAQSLFSKSVSQLVPQPHATSWNTYWLSPLKIFDRFTGTNSASLTADVHALTLPFKVFFLLNLIVISFVMTAHFKKITEHYSHWLPGIEVGMLVGTFSVLFFPLMSQAFLFANEALVGASGLGFFTRIVPVLSLAFGLWTLSIMLFFYRGRNKESEIAAKIIGAGLGVVTLVKYEAIVGFLVQVIGAGAHSYVLVAIVLICLAIALATRYAISHQTRPIDLTAA